MSRFCRKAASGATVTITVTPDEGCLLEALTVLDKDGNELKLTDKGGGKYTFTMPASGVTVTATFMDCNTMLNFFMDVKAFYDAVLWAAQKGITSGTDDTHFSPNESCTRAQAVAFLFRYAAPEAVILQEPVSGFSDAASVPGYARSAMNRALAGGIVQGGGSKLMPNDSCTRAQTVTFLYRALEK